ncbi:hypothetical protein [Andreprevotia chitinilytica]|uniref:hypothetical protein n=1 Tax=Andreprevotia chitinilytica TaxID=396808 RepID=UPI0005515465|nr:hypothetical protein [Andreprevotia chitinilytica]
MGLLDELKQQAESTAANHAQEKANYQRNVVAVDAALRQVFAYLDELVQQLRVIKPTNAHRYHIWGVGEWTMLAFERAAVDMRKKSIDSADWANTLEFAVMWKARAPFSASYGSQSEANYLKDKLWNLGLKLEEKIVKNAEAKFQRAIIHIEPHLPTRLRFEADFNTGQIQLTVRNLDGLQEDVVVLEPEQCNTTLCEELAKSLLGRPSKVAELLKRS